MQIYILTPQGKTLCALSNDINSNKALTFYDSTFTQILNKTETFEFTTFMNHRNSEYIQYNNKVIFKYEDKYHLFTITEIEEEHADDHSIKVYCEGANLELLNSVVSPSTNESKTAREALNIILANTEWNAGIVDDLGSNDIELSNYGTVLSEVQKLSELYSCDIQYRIEYSSSNGVLGKYIDLFKEIGESKGTRFEYGKNISSATKKINIDNLVTAVIPIGKNDLNITDIECTEYQHGFVKNKGVAYVALSEDERSQISDTPYHIFGTLSIDTDDPYELAVKAWEHLNDNKIPTIEYTFNPVLLNRDISLGETVYCIDSEISLTLEARVSEYKICFEDNSKDSITLSNYKEKESEIDFALISTIQSQLKNTEFENNVIVSDTMPTPENGKEIVWIDTSGVEYADIINIKTWDGEKWIDSLTPSDVENTVVENIESNNTTIYNFIGSNSEMKVYKQSTTPANGVNGQLWLDTSTSPNVWKKYNASTNTWEALIVAGVDKDLQVTVGTINTDLSNTKNDLLQVKDDLLEKANQIDFDSLEDRVTTNETDITNIEGELSTKVSSTTYEQDKTTLTNRINTAESNITQNANEISTKVSQSTYETDKNGLEERISTAESNITQNANQIATKVTQTEVDNSIDAIKIGSSNLLAMKDIIISDKTYEYNGKYEIKLTNNQGYGGIRWTIGSLDLKSSTDYIFSFYFKFESGTLYNVGGHWRSDHFTSYIKLIAIDDITIDRAWQSEANFDDDVLVLITDGNWHRFIVSFMTKENIESYSSDQYIQVQPNRANSTLTVTRYKNFQIEEGNKVTGWSPSYKDTDNDIRNLTTRVTTAESSIVQNANEIATKVSQSTYETNKNLLDERLTTAESNITQNANEIATKVSQTTYNNDKNDITNRLTTAESNINQNANQIATKVSQTTYDSDKNGITSRLDTAESNITQNANEISTKVSQTTYDVDMSNLTSRMTSAESNITQNANNIATKVSQTDFNALGTMVSSAETAISQNTSDIALKASKEEFTTVSNKVDDNTTNISELQTRMSSAELKITDSAIIGTVTNSSTFETALNNNLSSAKSYTDTSVNTLETNVNSELETKANTTDLDTLATLEQLNSSLESIDYEGIIDSRIAQMIEDGSSPINLQYVTQTQLEQTNTSISQNISMANGLNLIKNSTGFSGFDFWTISRPTLSSTGTDPTLDSLGIGCSFHFSSDSSKDKNIQQSFNTEIGKYYTLSLYIKKTNKTTDSTLRGQIQFGFRNSSNSSWKIMKQITNSTLTNGYELYSVSFLASENSAYVRIYMYPYFTGSIAGIMVNEGTIPLKWSLASGEMYNTNVLTDINGIRVMRKDENGNVDGYTSITPDEFAGYYDTDKDGTYEKVFNISEDITTSKKFQATNEITMGNIKIVPVSNGWAFVKV